MSVPPGVLISLVGIAGMLAALIGLVILRLTLTRRLNSRLRTRHNDWTTGTTDLGFVNTALFAWACAIPSIQQLPRFQLLFNELDVRAFASSFERGTAYGTIGGLVLFFLCGGLYLLFTP